MNSVIAAVLAGGRGQRLEHLTQNQPKPMVPYAGRCRMIDFSIENCAKSSIREVVLMSKHLELTLVDYLHQQWGDKVALNFGPLDPATQSSAEMTAIANARPDEFGTADALISNRPYIDQDWVDDVLVLHSDHVYNFDYAAMLDQHQRTGAALTLGYQRIPIEYVKLFGMVRFDDQGQLIEFVEKHPNPTSDCVFTAVGIFNKAIMYDALDELQNSDWKHDISFDLIPLLMQRGEKILGFAFEDYWEDIGTIERYYKAHMRLLADHSHLRAPTTLPGADELALYQTPQFDRVLMPQALATQSFTAQHSFVFPGADIGNGAQLENSLVLPGAKVSAGESLSRCIIGPDGRSQL